MTERARRVMQAIRDAETNAIEVVEAVLRNEIESARGEPMHCRKHGVRRCGICEREAIDASRNPQASRPPGWTDHPSDMKRAMPISTDEKSAGEKCAGEEYEKGYAQAIQDVCALLERGRWPHIRNEVEAMLRRRSD